MIGRIALLLLLAAPAHAEPVQIPGPAGVALRAELHRPSAPRAVPAIVALHGCGGAFPARDRQWAKLLTDAGHVVLFPDSFGSRGLGSQCRERTRLASANGLRRLDAFAAASWLAAQPGITSGGVVLLGWSDGGSTVVAAARVAVDAPKGLLRGLIAFYPGCTAASRSAGWQPMAPLLVLMGEADDWTPVAPCGFLASNVGAAMQLVTYPGAYHDFDAPVPVQVRTNIPSSQNPDKSVHLGGNPAARDDAIRRVMAYLAALPAL